MTESGTTICESCGTALLDDEPSCWRCGHHTGAGPVLRRRRRVFDPFILLVLAAVASFGAMWALRIARQLPPNVMSDLPSCTEEEGVSERFTEIWRLSMDEALPVFVRDQRVVEATVDRSEKVEGLASNRFSVSGPSHVGLGIFSLDGSLLGRPLDGRTLVVRARIRAEGDFPADVVLGVTVSGADPFSVGPLDLGAEGGGPWRLYELTYIGSPDHEGGVLELWMGIVGTGTVWIDDVRILRGPQFGSARWGELLVTERVRRPAAGVATVLDALTTDGRQEVDELIESARETPLYRAYAQRSPGADPPDRVQRCLTELYLAMETREQPPPLAQLWMDVAGMRRVSPAIFHWHQTIYGFHQPDYLERLVRVSPSADLVATYGRDVVPPMLAHGAEILGVAEPERPRGPLEIFELRGSSRSFVEMTDLLLRQADAGHWELSIAEREELRALLEAHLSNGPEDQRFDLIVVPPENRELLELVLRRLGSEAVGPEPEPGPEPDAEQAPDEEFSEATRA